MAEEDAARPWDGRASAPPLVGSRTHEHLRTAFAIEAQAQSLLTYFALIAEIEGRPDLAQLLQDLAEAHGLHAHGHLDLLTRAADPLASRPMGPTANNLDCVLAAEDHASRDLYSPMIKTA